MAPADGDERVHLFVAGRVQGVFFRASTARRARELGLTGWVRNVADGRVEVVAEGAPERVRELLAFCRSGPPAARVSEVEASWAPADGAYRDFDVRY